MLSYLVSIKTRILQLLARYIGVVLAMFAVKMHMTVDPSQTTEVSNYLAMYVVAGGLFILDHILHPKVIKETNINTAIATDPNITPQK